MGRKRGITQDEMEKLLLTMEERERMHREVEDTDELVKVWVMLLPRRKELNLTQEQVAERMGVSQSMVSDLETKVKRLDFENVTYAMTNRYAHALGLHVQLGIVSLTH